MSGIVELYFDIVVHSERTVVRDFLKLSNSLFDVFFGVKGLQRLAAFDKTFFVQKANIVFLYISRIEQ